MVGFADELPAAYQPRRIELGFHPGEGVSCLLAPGLGAPRVFQVSNTVYSLDRELASRVEVGPL